MSSRLTLDGFYVLEVTHEGTEEVKRARKNTFIKEYGMFRMFEDENIYDLQKRFTHIANLLLVECEVRTNWVGLTRHHVLVSEINHCVPFIIFI